MSRSDPVAGATDGVQPAVRRRLWAWATTVHREERERALSRLAAETEVTDTQREVVDAVAAAIVVDLLAEADAAVANARPGGPTPGTVARLFALDGERPR